MTRQRKLLIALTCGALVIVAFLALRNRRPVPPEAAIVYVKWPEEYSGRYLLQREEAVTFFDELWRSTAPDDFMRSAWYMDMHVFLVDKQGEVYAGFYVRPTQVTDGGESLRYLAELAKKSGTVLTSTELDRYSAGIASRLKERERALINRHDDL